MNIYLIGFMGSGKSSLGKKLASRLDREFVDLDKLIEEKENKSITDIFDEKGEDYFRKVEQSNLFSLPSSREAVVALGGGACCNDLSWNFLDQNGLIIYLKEKEEILLGRLRQNRSQRPLIAHLENEELKAFVKDKVKERSEYYDRAHFVFEKEKTSMDFLVDQIHQFLNV